ncbi:MAG TPA: hypothetical protein VGS21_11935, partial [Acidimicrobiales bacterium]|nr:hypothetical protein [Acidimicrobiales bacterium]
MPDSKWFRRVKRWWPIGRFVIGIALGAFALWTLNGQRGELAGATAELSHLHTQYIALGAFSEILSLSAFAGMQVWLLRCGDVHVSLPRVIGITFGSGAIANSIPGGPAVSSVFAFRQYRRAGADEAIAGWTLIATLTCAGLSLMLLATAGVLIAERQGASDDLIGVTIGATIVAVALSVIVWQRRMAVGIAAALVRLSQKLTGRPRGEA